MLEHVLADVVVEFGEDLGQGLRRDGRNQLLAVVGRQEPHQVGDVGRVQVADEFGQLGRVATVGRLDHHLHIAWVEGVVVAERQAIERLGRGLQRGRSEIDGGAGHAPLPSLSAK